MKAIRIFFIIAVFFLSACNRTGKVSSVLNKEPDGENSNFSALQNSDFDFPDDPVEEEDQVPAGLQYIIAEDNTVIISGYDGTDHILLIPEKIEGLPVTMIGDSAFRWTDLTRITVPSSVKRIENWPFTDNEKLAEIIVDPDNAFYSDINGVLFDKNKRILIQYPYGRESTSYTIPSSVTAIGIMAFSGNTFLENVTIPSSVTSIDIYAFLASSLTSVSIPASVTFIGGRAFDGCRSLTEINVDGENPLYSSVDGVLFDKNMENLIQYPAGREEESYTVPSSVVNINDFAFNIAQLSKVFIPPSVLSIGEYAFYYSLLIDLDIPPTIFSVGRMAFFGSTLTSITLSRKTQIGRNAFSPSARQIYID